MKKKRKKQFELNQQLLIYIKRESGIGENKVVKAIKIGFTLLNKRNKLVVSIFIGFIVNKIGQNTIYIDIRVNI